MKGWLMNTKNLFNKIMIASFCGVMVLGFVLGLAFFLRPNYSESEKRELTKFPTFTVSTFLSGEYTEQISTWFADTFPFREGLIALNDTVTSLKGFGSEQFQSGAANLGGEQNQGGNAGDNFGGNVGGSEDVKVETIAGYYIQGDTAYEMYYQNKANSERYAALINQAASKLNGKAKVYTVVVPLAYAYNDKVLKKTDATDPKAAIDSIYANVTHKNAYKVDAYSALGAHKDEYLYFRTDHHWTARGAYYAYTAYCQSAGLTAHELGYYEKLEFGGFLGTLYSHTKAPALQKHPDTVEAFVPRGTNNLYVHTADGERSKFTGGVVRKDTDTMYAAAASKYNCFLTSDNPLGTKQSYYCSIENPNIQDGSAVVLVKESFGNCFAPFLVDHYQYVYVIDYRYFDGDLTEFVTEKGAGAVIFLNNITATSAAPRIGEMEALVN